MSLSHSSLETNKNENWILCWKSAKTVIEDYLIIECLITYNWLMNPGLLVMKMNKKLDSVLKVCYKSDSINLTFGTLFLWFLFFRLINHCNVFFFLFLPQINITAIAKIMYNNTKIYVKGSIDLNVCNHQKLLYSTGSQHFTDQTLNDLNEWSFFAHIHTIATNRHEYNDRKHTENNIIKSRYLHNHDDKWVLVVQAALK